MSRRIVSRSIAVAGVLTLALHSGCLFSPPDGGGGGQVFIYRPLTTPYAPLYNLEKAYANRGQEAYDRYAELFDPVLYKFIWDDTSTPTLEDSYNYTEEIKTREMFVDASVASLSLTFLVNDADSLGTPSNTVGDPPGTQRFTINGLSLSLDRPPTTYVTSGTAEFFVAPIDNNGKTEWKIIRWRDLTSPPISTAPALQNEAPNAVGSALLRAAALADALGEKERAAHAAAH